MIRGRVETGVVILAAGLSSRFGGRPKALAESGGRSLLRAVVDKSRLAGLGRIKVVTGHHKTAIDEAAGALDVETIHNPDYEQGMFSSVKAGVRAMAGTESFFVWPVDAALTHAQTLLTLLAAWNRSRANGEASVVMVPVFNYLTGHPPLFSARCLDDIAAWPGDGGLRGWIVSLMNGSGAQALFKGRRPDCSEGPVSFINVPDEGVTSDIDTLDDLAAAREPAGGGRPSLEEAWQLLLQHDPGRNKTGHCLLVAAAAFRLALALRKAGRQVDPDLALLGGLLHDIARDHKQHDQQGMMMAQNLGWPEIGRVIGAHTDPPAEVLRACFEPARFDSCRPDDGPPGREACPGPLAEACLSVYLADKFALGRQPVTLKARFNAARHHCRTDAEALKAVLRREQTALMVEDWFRQRINAEPFAAAQRMTYEAREETLRRLG